MHKLSVDAFPEQKQLDKGDYVIICGDFGGVWDGGKTDKYIQKRTCMFANVAGYYLLLLKTVK